jgi:hypothetical protein
VVLAKKMDTPSMRYEWFLNSVYILLPLLILVGVGVLRVLLVFHFVFVNLVLLVLCIIFLLIKNFADKKN